MSELPRASRAPKPARVPGLPRPPRMLDRFELVLLLVLATIVVQALVDVRSSVLAGIFTHAISGLALLAAVRASGARRRWRLAVDVLVITVAVASFVILAIFRNGGPDSGVPPATVWLLAAGLTPVLVARRLLQHAEVTVQTVMGAVSAYLQIAVAFAYLYQTIDAFSESSFFGEEVSTTVYTYFSLITLTTVGFGDYTPATDLGQLAAGSEAVIGQVFLVTFVALIVARFAARLPRARVLSDAEVESRAEAEAQAETQAESQAQVEAEAPTRDP